MPLLHNEEGKLFAVLYSTVLISELALIISFFFKTKKDYSIFEGSDDGWRVCFIEV
ncbi:hypothetical protein BCR42DRAFT_413070 [Absidia repens]|uniref:Uncharacterized protein n=1 Tax=Absidia repens TaxID=90262 RepID=A0A1X2IKI9_9FUNG|nr:hypothetical protein BCR42DRAFT_413070 [Absidia repens]